MLPMRSGFVYVFSNPGLTAYTIGMSTGALYLRAFELTREYGTVYPFEIASFTRSMILPPFKPWLASDTTFPAGSEFLAEHKGKSHTGVVKDGKLVLSDGHTFNTRPQPPPCTSPAAT